MSRGLRAVLNIGTLLIFLGLVALAFLFYRRNPITLANKLKEKAKDEYLAKEYVSAYKTYEILIDSMQLQDDKTLLNYANAAMLTSSVLKDGVNGQAKGQQIPLGDSVIQQISSNANNTFTILTISEDEKISSYAYNQSGYSEMKVKNGEASDSILFIALENFKMALKKNPDNDSARYNYELLKKIIGFPETILAQTKSLVAQKRYIEAANLLETSMARDVRLARQKDFLNRIKAVAGIDTTYKARQL